MYFSKSSKSLTNLFWHFEHQKKYVRVLLFYQDRIYLLHTCACLDRCQRLECRGRVVGRGWGWFANAATPPLQSVCCRRCTTTPSVQRHWDLRPRAFVSFNTCFMEFIKFKKGTDLK